MFVLLVANGKSHILFPDEVISIFKSSLHRLHSQTHNQGKYSKGSHCQILVVLLLPTKSDQLNYFETGLAVFRPYARPGGLPNKVLNGEDPPQSPTSYPFIYYF